MGLALQTDFALRTLLYLVARPGRSTIAQVAEFYRISPNHVAKVVNLLARRGYLLAVRGIGGGFELSRPAEEISIGQVVDDFEGRRPLLACVAMENVCIIQPACKLRRVLAEAQRIQREYLDSVRLIDVVRPTAGLAQFPLIPLSALRGNFSTSAREPGEGSRHKKQPARARVSKPLSKTSKKPRRAASKAAKGRG